MVFAGGAMLAAGIGATLIAGRLRLPGLILFLGLGMLVGSDGLGWVEFDDYGLARNIGIIALALLLFEGGLSAGFNELRPVAGPAISLAVFGTLATAALTGIAAALLFDFDTLESMLVGSILAAHASLAARAVGERTTLENLGSQLQRALLSRDVIGQAKGILIERFTTTPEDAFEMLKRSSQKLNVKLREVARILAETGELEK